MDSRRLFETLVRENAQSLMIFLRAAVRDGHAAEELFQETLVIAWKTLDRFDRERSFGRWLRGIARNVIRSHRRKLATAVLEDPLLDVIDAHCESVQRMRNDVLDEKLERLRACIDALPPRYKDAVRYEEEIRGTELAERLETSWESTKKLLQRGRRMLFECMERKWTFAEAGRD